jgi:hypothetical protein
MAWWKILLGALTGLAVFLCITAIIIAAAPYLAALATVGIAIYVCLQWADDKPEE